MIAAAETTGCEAVHPGYGFLSENPAFVRACEDNDLVFVGPGADVMERMGDKAQAKAEMRAAGVPLVPGTEGGATLAEVRAAASELGFPVLLKAVSGGGGKGMRLVYGPDELEAAYSTARAEAEAAFSDGSLYLEKALVPARHVEIQVLCDEDGGVLTLGERECSIQRRHQKLIEESPSPALDAGDARGDGGGGRARLPRDRLRERGHVRVPARRGRHLPLHRAERAPAGRASGQRARDRDRHRARAAADRGRRAARPDRPRAAPRARARDPAERRGSGARLRARAGDDRRASGRRSGPGVRVDTHLEEGSTISPYYDSLIAKLVVWAEDRPAAIARAVRALDELELDGVPTTRELALDILRSPEFGSGDYSTSFLAEMEGRLPALACGGRV